MATNLKVLLLRVLTTLVAFGSVKVLLSILLGSTEVTTLSGIQDAGGNDAVTKSNAVTESVSYYSLLDRDLFGKLYQMLLYSALLTVGQVMFRYLVTPIFRTLVPVKRDFKLWIIKVDRTGAASFKFIFYLTMTLLW